MERKGRPGTQRTLESLAKVVVLPSASHAFSAADVLSLKAKLEAPDASSAVLLTALRTLSCLEVSVSDLQASLVGRAAKRLCASSDEEVAKLAARLVSKWRDAVSRASAPSLKRKQATLAETGAAFDAELGGPRRATTPSGAQRDACRAALTAALGVCNSSLAVSIESALYQKALSRYAHLSESLPRAVSTNPSLHSALLSGWILPAEVVALAPAKLLTQDFLSTSV